MRELLFETIALFGRGMSPGFAARFGNGLGRLLWKMLRKRRKLARRAIAEHLGVPKDEAKRIAKASFKQNARSFVEIMLTHQMGPRFLAERVTFAEPENVRFLAETKRPVVFATGHLGAWELQTGSLAAFPGKRKIVVVRLPKDKALHAIMMRLRTRPSVDVVPHRQA